MRYLILLLFISPLLSKSTQVVHQNQPGEVCSDNDLRGNNQACCTNSMLSCGSINYSACCGTHPNCGWHASSCLGTNDICKVTNSNKTQGTCILNTGSYSSANTPPDTIPGQCQSGYTGSCSYTCTEGSPRPRSNTCRRQCYGATINHCTLATTTQGNRQTGTCSANYQGSGTACRYDCQSTGTWSAHTTCTRSNGCDENANHNNCVLGQAMSTASSGTCRSGYTGSCSYRCNNGSWGLVSNNCRVSNSGGGGGCSPGNPGDLTQGDSSCLSRYGGKNGKGWVCFLSDTLITMADGTQKVIQDIKVDDKLKGQYGINTVLSLKKLHARPYKGLIYSINNSRPFVTIAHPFLTTSGWKAFNKKEAKKINPTLDIKELQIGDILIKDNDKKEEVKSFYGEYQDTKVYNFTVSGDKTYYADGYLVHNR